MFAESCRLAGRVMARTRRFTSLYFILSVSSVAGRKSSACEMRSLSSSSTRFRESNVC
jgi:hypothetical protein